MPKEHDAEFRYGFRVGFRYRNRRGILVGSRNEHPEKSTSKKAYVKEDVIKSHSETTVSELLVSGSFSADSEHYGLLVS